MSRSNPGIKQLVSCNAGTLATTPAGILCMSGIRNNGTFKRTAYKPIKDVLNGSWRNKENFRIEIETLQSTMYALDTTLDFLNLGCDTQLIDYDGNCYKFTGDSALGLEFEYLIDGDKRVLKHIYEAAFPYADAKALIDAADSATPIAFSGITGRGEDQTKMRAPSFISFEFPKTTVVLTRRELGKRSYSFKSKSKKSEEDNTSQVDYISCEINLSFRNASVAEQILMMAKDNAPSLYIKEGNAGSFYDAFDFASGILTLDDEFEDSDEESNINLKFTRDIHKSDITFEYGAAKGGDAGDTSGLKGGTMKFG
jgi:hypothetical protein